VISPFAPEQRQKTSTPPQGTPKRLDPELSGEPQPFPLTRKTPRPLDAQEPAEDGWEPPLAPDSSFGRVSKPPRRKPRTDPGIGKAGDVEIEARESLPDQDVLDAIAREEEAPLAPSSRSIAFGPRRLRPRQSAKELALPSVIIDVENECALLVEQLVEGDLAAGEARRDRRAGGEHSGRALSRPDHRRPAALAADGIRASNAVHCCERSRRSARRQPV
jgi:hypothetical protein